MDKQIKRPTIEQLVSWAKIFPRQIDFSITKNKPARYYHTERTIGYDGWRHWPEERARWFKDVRPASGMGVIMFNPQEDWSNGIPFKYEFDKYILNHSEVELLLGIDFPDYGDSSQELRNGISLRVGEVLLSHPWNKVKANAYTVGVSEEVSMVLDHNSERKVIPVKAVPFQFFNIKKEDYGNLMDISPSLLEQIEHERRQ